MSVTWMPLTARLLVEPAGRRAAADYRVAVAATTVRVSRLASFPDAEILGLGLLAELGYTMHAWRDRGWRRAYQLSRRRRSYLFPP